MTLLSITPITVTLRSTRERGRHDGWENKTENITKERLLKNQDITKNTKISQGNKTLGKKDPEPDRNR